jgi:hypothetical protein
VAYRPIRISAPDGPPETFWVRIPDAAVASWLAERPRLRMDGYPDRPPDVDTATLRAWLPRVGEETLRHVLAGGGARHQDGEGGSFMIATFVWHQHGGLTTKVLISGLADGSILSRVRIEDAATPAPVDKARRYGPEVDPDTAWSEIETVIQVINKSPMGWSPGDPKLTTYLDFLDLDREIAASGAEAAAFSLVAVARPN